MPTPPHLLQRAAQGCKEALSALLCARKACVHRLAATLLAGGLELPSDAAATTEELADERARGLSRWASARGAPVEAPAQDQGPACARESGRLVEAGAPENLFARFSS